MRATCRSGPTGAISDVLFDVALGKFTYCFAPITLALPAIELEILFRSVHQPGTGLGCCPMSQQSPRPEYLDLISHFGMGFGHD